MAWRPQGRRFTGFWSTILEYFFLVPVPLRNNYEIKVYTFFSLVASKPSNGAILGGPFDLVSRVRKVGYGDYNRVSRRY